MRKQFKETLLIKTAMLSEVTVLIVKISTNNKLFNTI